MLRESTIAFHQLCILLLHSDAVGLVAGKWKVFFAVQQI